MTGPREPRQWNQRSEEPPPDVRILHGRHFAKGDGQYLVRCKGGGWIWSHQAGTDVRFGTAWDGVASLARGPLTEVLRVPAPETGEHRLVISGSDHGSYVGNCSCAAWWVSYRDPADVATGWMEHVENPTAPVSSGRGATNPMSAGKDAETSTEDATDDLRVQLASVLDPAIWTAELDEQSTVGARYQWHERRQASLVFAENALTAGWRPPLPEGETQWSVREEDAPGWYYGPTTDEADAREEAACRPGNTLGKRAVWYGPWTEVPR